MSGAPRPPSAHVVARLLSAVDFRPAVLELLNPRFPPAVRETAAAALRVAEMGPAAAFPSANTAGAQGRGSCSGDQGFRAGASRGRGHRDVASRVIKQRPRRRCALPELGPAAAILTVTPAGALGHGFE